MINNLNPNEDGLRKDKIKNSAIELLGIRADLLEVLNKLNDFANDGITCEAVMKPRKKLDISDEELKAIFENRKKKHFSDDAEEK